MELHLLSILKNQKVIIWIIIIKIIILDLVFQVNYGILFLGLYCNSYFVCVEVKSI